MAAPSGSATPRVRGIPPAERLEQLPGQIGRHCLVDPIALRQRGRQVERPEAPVQPRQHRGVVLPPQRGVVIGVVPVVEGRRGDHILQPAEAPAHIGMHEEPPESADQREQNGHHVQPAARRLGQPEQIHRRQAAEPAEHAVDRMGAGIDQEIHLLGAVMDGMEAPQQRHLVHPAMRPVIPRLTHHHRRGQAQPQRQGCHRGVVRAGHRAMRRPGDGGDRQHQQQLGHQVAQEIPPDIGAQPHPPHTLPLGREEPFQRDEHDRDQHEPDAQTNNAEEEGGDMHDASLRRGAAIVYRHMQAPEEKYRRGSSPQTPFNHRVAAGHVRGPARP